MSLGPESAVLTSVGTLYIYRLASADMAAYAQMPATWLAPAKFRALLPRIASTSVSDTGVREAGPIEGERVDKLDDEELERIAEAYLEGPSLRWVQQEGSAAASAIVRTPGERALAFLDRLIPWYVDYRARNRSPSGSLTMPPPRPAEPPLPAGGRDMREVWIALAALAVVAVLAVGALVQNYFLGQAVSRQQEAIVAQLRQSNALLADHVARSNRENAELRTRLDALEATLRARAQAQAAREPAKPKIVPKPPKERTRTPRFGR